jgi:CRISPR-associated exonuclease Cas4
MDTLDTDPIPISAIEHYSYCPRQCALIHVEHVWDENIHTMRGRIVHENVDEEGCESVGGVRVERALPVWSRRLGVTGKMDMVEFTDGVPYPVEYKSGRKKKGTHEALQLCLYAMCLEEMFGSAVDRGAIYWYASKKRMEVEFTADVRARALDALQAVREVIESGDVPPAPNDERCKECSLLESCMPAVTSDRRRARRIGNKLFKDVPNETAP